MSDVLMALIAALVGALGGYFTGRLGWGVVEHRFNIHITEAGGVYSSKTNPPTKRVKGGERVAWKITPEKKLPAGSLIYLEFPNGSCLVHPKPDDGKGGTDISSFVKFSQTKQPYAYKIHYIDPGGTSHLLEDPELIIEGDQPFVVR